MNSGLRLSNLASGDLFPAPAPCLIFLAGDCWRLSLQKEKGAREGTTCPATFNGLETENFRVSFIIFFL